MSDFIYASAVTLYCHRVEQSGSAGKQQAT